jgi:predicted transcriptional regulator
LVTTLSNTARGPKVTQEELEILKLLKIAGKRGCTVRAFLASAALKRLVKDGYVVDQQTALDLVHYRITRRGEEVLGSTR